MNEKARFITLLGGAVAERKHRHYDVDISLKNLRHHWNACSRTSAASSAVYAVAPVAT